MAQRSATSARIYSLTRTLPELVLDVQAWLASFSVPIALVMPSSGGGGGRGGAVGPIKSKGGRWDWLNGLRKPLARSTRLHELPNLDQQLTPGNRAVLRSALTAGMDALSPRSRKRGPRKAPWLEGAKPRGWKPTGVWAEQT